MNGRTLSLVIGVLVLLALAVGAAGAIPHRLPPLSPAAGATVSGGISYQGRLAGADGAPLDGAYTMRFVIYDDPISGSSVWDSGDVSVTVEDGLFTTTLDVDSQAFDGQALWLSIVVEGEILSPRQELLPAPYALGLRPGAEIVGESISAGDAVLAGNAPATGTALRAQANGGVGVFGTSEDNVAVWGGSENSWGGYFTSDLGSGLRVDAGGEEIFHYGAHVTSNRGYAVYAQSAQNQALRGEAGDVTDFYTPLGAVGVVGIGANRGVYGSSDSGTGVYGVSENNYGLWAQSINWRGVTGITSRSDNNYGFYTPDNLYSANINMAGALMQVMQNGDTEPLSPGDVVAFSGINHTVAAVDGPVVQVRQAGAANSTAVAGVVHSRFNIDAVNPDLQAPDDSAPDDSAPAHLAAMEVTPPGPAAPGDYVLVVVQGPTQVKAGALSGDPIQPGDLLSAGADAGLAAKAQTITVDGAEATMPGAVFAKALEPLADRQEKIWVYVTLR
ncbi:MAG: hypothetical protein ACOCXI_13205 [Chloroflexota bacterium]